MVDQKLQTDYADGEEDKDKSNKRISVFKKQIQKGVNDMGVSLSLEHYLAFHNIFFKSYSLISGLAEIQKKPQVCCHDDAKGEESQGERSSTLPARDQDEGEEGPEAGARLPGQAASFAGRPEQGA